MADPKAYKAKLTDALKPDERNLNRHTQRGQRLVENSQRKRGFGRPGFAASDGTVLGGNLSVIEVATDIGLGDGEVFIVETDGDIPIIHLRRDLDSDSNEAALLAAEDNHSALKSINYDPEMLLAEIERGIDFEGIFETNEVKEILAEIEDGGAEEPGEPQIDKAEELRETWGVEVGQVWQLGRHRVACGDCTDRAVVEGVMRGEKVDCLFTDPPYGVKRDEGFGGHDGFGGIGTPIARRQYGGGWDKERPSGETFQYFIDIAKEAFIFGGNFFADILPKSTCWLVWDKLNTMPTFGDCELIWTNLDRKSVKKITFEYNGLIGKEPERFHATQKPVGLMSELIDNYVDGNTILDPFLGSGTTMIAAHQLNHRCFGIEISPAYTAVCLQRFADYSKVDPVLLSE